ncbi:hypothetical protein VOLCADRAFT_89991 [Volvox carteri f. nagariensis]|uniref:Uncharacterized protein n=1 Tax=Volvox carteri f. nagariensis TaxID=3068 RepID=D8TT72_VOLCA|nr:uncharacterized protein VOLCADRAFT_89991 [Volvox carteri f. nagariensis]EFJ49145.1 hypothetical protein VOLCADRAFT_89991 [Volvox carteri f. nagariensis]|eukprot:XP_002949593.1 hypothetical protein VOLCADRAFT_89991 [Volvox carteri f. nagariensis]
MIPIQLTLKLLLRLQLRPLALVLPALLLLELFFLGGGPALAAWTPLRGHLAMGNFFPEGWSGAGRGFWRASGGEGAGGNYQERCVSSSASGVDPGKPPGPRLSNSSNSNNSPGMGPGNNGIRLKRSVGEGGNIRIALSGRPLAVAETQAPCGSSSGSGAVKNQTAGGGGHGSDAMSYTAAVAWRQPHLDLDGLRAVLRALATSSTTFTILLRNLDITDGGTVVRGLPWRDTAGDAAVAGATTPSTRFIVERCVLHLMQCDPGGLAAAGIQVPFRVAAMGTAAASATLPTPRRPAPPSPSKFLLQDTGVASSDTDEMDATLVDIGQWCDRDSQVLATATGASFGSAAPDGPMLLLLLNLTAAVATDGGGGGGGDATATLQDPPARHQGFAFLPRCPVPPATSSCGGGSGAASDTAARRSTGPPAAAAGSSRDPRVSCRGPAAILQDMRTWLRPPVLREGVGCAIVVARAGYSPRMPQ